MFKNNVIITGSKSGQLMIAAGKWRSLCNWFGDAGARTSQLGLHVKIEVHNFQTKYT